MLSVLSGPLKLALIIVVGYLLFLLSSQLYQDREQECVQMCKAQGLEARYKSSKVSQKLHVTRSGTCECEGGAEREKGEPAN